MKTYKSDKGFNKKLIISFSKQSLKLKMHQIDTLLLREESLIRSNIIVIGKLISKMKILKPLISSCGSRLRRL